MHDNLKIGFVGSGGLARHHMSQVAKYGSTVAAISDVNPDASQAPAEQYGANVYSNHEEMLEKESLDAVYIAVPPFAHGEIELALCEAKLPFFVQKPVALDMETARRIEAAVQQSGVITCVGYQLRYTPTAQRLKRLLQGQKVGMGVGRYWCGFTQEMTRGWLIDRKLSGGQMIEQATHTIDMIRYLAGEVTEVYGHEAKMLRGGGDCPDVNCALLKLASGGAVMVSATWGGGDPNDWSQTNQLQLFWDRYRADWNPGSLTVSPEESSDESEAGESEPEREIDEVFLEAVRSGDGSAILSPYSDGVMSLAVSVGYEKSAATGRPVKLDV
jgi:predicted dehydrogenase